MPADPIGAAQQTIKAVALKVLTASGEPVTRTIRNSGAQAVTLSRESGVASGAGYKLAAAGEIRVTLNPGESLYGICAGGQETTLELV